jgi:phosphohistidine phosphatase SixA
MHTAQSARAQTRNVPFAFHSVFLPTLSTEDIQSTMRRHKIARQFYLKPSVVALAIVSACATAQKPVVDQTAPGVTTVYIVRHAEKSTMVANDPDPDLTSVGQRRAQALASRLGTAGVTAIIISQFKRSQETAQPIAAALGIQPEIIPAGARTSSDSVAAAVLRHRGGKVLIVGHSNTIPGIIQALGGPLLPNLCDNEYSNLFLIYLPASGKPELTRQHYGASDPAPDQACQEMQAR